MRATTVIAYVLLAIFGGSLVTAEQPSLETGGFAETVHVNVVNVEVYVSDKQGGPVTGLTAADFEVYENRDPMEITNFYAVEGGRRVTETALPLVEPAPLVPAGPAAEPAVAEPAAEDERLRLMVFVDNFNLRPLERKRVSGQVSQFLRRHLGREDQVMLVSYDRALHLRHPFTNDPALIADAILELDQTRAEGQIYDAARQRILREMELSEHDYQARSLIRPFAEQVYHDLGGTINGIREAIEILAGLPGRKAVLHISSGIPMIAAGDLYLAIQQMHEMSSMMSEMMEYDTSRRFEELGALANANGVTFYTLDAGGLRVYASKTAEQEGLDEARISHRIDSDEEANRQEPLRFLAQRTGGRAILNLNEVYPALVEAADDFRSFYSLGYSPPHHGDGRFYSIKVEVKRRGVQVRHRKGYRDKSTQTRMTEGTRSVLLHSVAPNPLGLEMVFGSPTPQGTSQFLVPFQVKIPLGRLVLLPRGEEHVGRIRLFVAAIDGQGNMSEVQDTPLGINIPATAAEAARGQHWLHSHRLLMGSGYQKVAVGVWDELGGVEAFVSRSLRIGE